MKGRFRLAALLAAVCLAPAASAQPRCAAPAAAAPAGALPHTRAVLRPGGRLDVLALGSASLLGPHGGVEGSLPDYMVQTLRPAAPGAMIHLTLRAARAEPVADMLAVLQRELAAHAYQLVLWQTGTVEALRRQPPPDQFRALLVQGADAVQQAGADLVLIDPPYSRLLESHAEIDPYRDALQEVAARPGALLFSRYALMRAWAESGQLDLEASARPDRRRTADLLRVCLGQALARLIEAAATAP